MSDDFDLLETNSNEKTEKVDVNWGKAIDQMKSKLAQEDDPDSRQKILNATLDNVVEMAEKDRSTLLDAIKDLTDYQDEVGIMFEGFSALNAGEQKIIDDAIKRLERAKVELEEFTVAQENTTKRWEADMHSDSWLSKNIRPLGMSWVLVMTTVLLIVAWAEVETPESVLMMFGGLATSITGGYYVLRTVEKRNTKKYK